MTRRQKILAAAEAGLISFYEGVTHEEIEFDCSGEPMKIQLTHGVCAGCVWNAEESDDQTERCCLHDPHHRAATVEEVAAYIGAVP